MGTGASKNSVDRDEDNEFGGPGGIRRNDKFKVLVVGASSTGKTAVFRRYVCNDFPYNYNPTSKVGVGVKLVEILADRGVAMCSLELWDCPSNQVILQVMEELYMEDMDGAVLVCDSTRPETWSAVSYWMERFKRQGEGGKMIPTVLLANKRDSPKSELTAEQLNEAVIQAQLSGGFFVSALDDRCVDDAMMFLVEKMVKKAMDRERFMGRKKLPKKRKKEEVLQAEFAQEDAIRKEREEELAKVDAEMKRLKREEKEAAEKEKAVKKKVSVKDLNRKYTFGSRLEAGSSKSKSKKNLNSPSFGQMPSQRRLDQKGRQASSRRVVGERSPRSSIGITREPSSRASLLLARQSGGKKLKQAGFNAKSASPRAESVSPTDFGVRSPRPPPGSKNSRVSFQTTASPRTKAFNFKQEEEDLPRSPTSPRKSMKEVALSTFTQGFAVRALGSKSKKNTQEEEDLPSPTSPRKSMKEVALSTFTQGFAVRALGSKSS